MQTSTLTRIRIAAYALLAWLYSQRQARQNGVADDSGAQSAADPDAAGSIVFYAATIGELQAVRPLIAHVQSTHPALNVVLLAGQSQYLESFRQAVPGAVVAGVPGPAFADMTAFFERYAPRLVVLSEGPALYGRFPIRLGLGLPAACLQYQVPLIVSNACLYELSLGSRIDHLEHRLFGDLHRAAIRHWYAPSASQRDDLCAAGIDTADISVCGDLKFDNLRALRERRPADALTPLLASLRGCPTVVGASLNHGQEEQALLAAWRRLRQRHPQARLVLAPRYVNRAEVMERIYALLQHSGVDWGRRSDGVDAVLARDVVVLDVFGELTHYFEVADICFMGRDHGVLEPLAFGKPMVAANRSDWQPYNTSYPLYRMMVDGRGLVELQGLDELGDTLIRLCDDAAFRGGYVDRATAIVAAQQGATERLRADISAYLDTAQPGTAPQHEPT